MTSMDASIPELLRSVYQELQAASTRDSASLARPRAKLAWIASMVPASSARRLLDTASEVASAIGLYETQADADVARLDAARRAVGVVVECLADHPAEDVMPRRNGAGQQLMRSVGRDPADWKGARAPFLDGG